MYVISFAWLWLWNRFISISEGYMSYADIITFDSEVMEYLFAFRAFKFFLGAMNPYRVDAE